MLCPLETLGFQEGLECGRSGMGSPYASNTRVSNMGSPRYLVAMRSWGKCLKS